MTNPTRYAIEPGAGFRSREAALFVAQLDDQSRRLIEDTRALTPAALERQPAAGQNTIGMLLAHVAFWEVLDLDRGEIGTPLPADGRPPAGLAGKDIAYFHDLLARARAHTCERARALTDADLEREVSRQRPDGTLNTFTLRWALYHMLEHLAAHYGQVNLMKHLQRAGAGGTPAAV